MFYIALIFTFASLLLHAFQGPIKTARARLDNLASTRQDIADGQGTMLEMQNDLRTQSKDINARQQKIADGRRKLALARCDLAEKIFVAEDLRDNLNESFDLQDQLLDAIDGILSSSKASIARAQQNLPAIRASVHKLYGATGRLHESGMAFIATADRKLHPIRGKRKRA